MVKQKLPNVLFRIVSTKMCRKILLDIVDIFMFCFKTAFPYKRVKLKEIRNNMWLSKGLIVSSKRLKFLNNPKRKFPLMREAWSI
jgi:hypothetical protein